jgi:uncharacterized protein involved in exopolysaccharide biosynthesis
MTSSELVPDRSAQEAGTAYVSWYSVLTPLVRGWRAILIAMALAVVVTAAVTLASARKYRANMTLSTVFNPRNASLGGGLSALLGGGSTLGLQATPSLVLLLSKQSGVLDRVAHTPLSGKGTETIGDRLRVLRRADIPDRDLAEALGKEASGGIDKETGAISIEIVSPDSVFARSLATQLVAEISRTFIRASKAQASQLRQAMQARVDSADKHLRSAEEEYRAFISANRVIQPFTEIAIGRDQRERARSLAQTVYTQAVTDRESAISRELEETPAVVVLDDLPRELPRVSRHIALKALAGAFAAAVLMSVLLLLRTSLAESSGDADVEEFSSALRSIPWIGPALLAVLRSPVRRPAGDQR